MYLVKVSVRRGGGKHCGEQGDEDEEEGKQKMRR